MSEVKETARPRFFIQPMENKAKSEKAGRPIFESRRFIEMKHPGDKSWSFVEEIDENGCGYDRRGPNGEPGEDYSLRFPREYAAFKKGEERAAIGTPIEEWTAISRSRAAELKSSNIFTVEEYADVQDGQLVKLGMGAREEREKARAFISTAKDGADVGAMAAELARLKELVEKLTGTQPVVEAPAEKPIEDCSDAELKEFIKRETGEAPRGNISRVTLLARVQDIVAGKTEAA